MNYVLQAAVPVVTGAGGFDREVDELMILLLPATALIPITGYLRLADDAFADARAESRDQSSYYYDSTAFSCDAATAVNDCNDIGRNHLVDMLLSEQSPV